MSRRNATPAAPAPKRFVRIADEISLTQSTHQIAAKEAAGSRYIYPPGNDLP